jgi:Peptidase propeptide and YPEB domain
MLMLRTAAVAAVLVFGPLSLVLAQSSTQSPPASSNTTDGPTMTNSGAPWTPTNVTEQEVRKKLESEGYSQISDVKQDKDGYMATAVKDGKQVVLDIDNNGKVAVTK